MLTIFALMISSSFHLQFQQQMTLSAFKEPILAFCFPHISHWEEYFYFQNWGVHCNQQVQEEKTKHQMSGLICRGGHLWSFASSQCSLVGSLQSLLGGLWSFAGGLQWFVVDACFSNYRKQLVKKIAARRHERLNINNFPNKISLPLEVSRLLK